MFQHPRVSVSVRIVVIDTHKSVISILASTRAQGITTAQLDQHLGMGIKFNQLLWCLLMVMSIST